MRVMKKYHADFSNNEENPQYRYNGRFVQECEDQLLNFRLLCRIRNCRKNQKKSKVMSFQKANDTMDVLFKNVKNNLQSTMKIKQTTKSLFKSLTPSLNPSTPNP